MAPQIRGWTLLSDNYEKAISAIQKATSRGINHLQLSHHLVHKLKHLEDPAKRAGINFLIDTAHAEGIEEVCIWDHSLYWPGYYPDRFKTGPGGTLDLDNEDFWDWFRRDYKRLLELAPEADGIVLTFIETGALISRQHSNIHITDAEKLALLIDTIAPIVSEEYGKKLYIRTFIYFHSELREILRCLELISSPGITVMCKEAPHDFIVTHPVNFWVEKVPFPVIVEFDCAHEFNGQGVTASLFPHVHASRWKHYQNLENVIGYTARVDRYKESVIIGKPTEVNFHALKSVAEDPERSTEAIVNTFIEENYGEKMVEWIKEPFIRASEVITSVYYTLGLPLNTHSHLSFTDIWGYTGLVSGRWMEVPEVTIEHDVNKKFHIWKDIVNHLASAEIKANEGSLGREILNEIRLRGWIDTDERMNGEYLEYIRREKDFGIDLARTLHERIVASRDHWEDPALFSELELLFHRTVLSACLFRDVAVAYFGSRVWRRGPRYQDNQLHTAIQEAVDRGTQLAFEISRGSTKSHAASYNWHADGVRALGYFEAIKQDILQGEYRRHIHPDTNTSHDHRRLEYDDTDVFHHRSPQRRSLPGPTGTLLFPDQ